jgi:hypothetical protein
VIEEGRCLNLKSMDDNSILYLGKLVSNVFERSWDMNKRPIPHEVLNHAVTWRSFPTYMGMLCTCKYTL